MDTQSLTTPVEDTVPKVGGELAVGENLKFQRRWWTFERIIWPIFMLIVLCDLLGALGHGWLAKAKVAVPGGGLTVDYERIERANSPSSMTLHFGPDAVRNGRIRVFLSNSIVQQLGAQRLAPQPAVSSIGQGGISYDFAASAGPADVQIQLQPADVGMHDFEVRVPGIGSVDARVLILP
jgi:hypothetical protein